MMDEYISYMTIMPEKLLAEAGTPFLSTIAGGLAILGWQLWRTKRGDASQDNLQNQFGELLEIMRALADEQTKRADVFAQQRNDMAAQVGRLEARLESKDSQIAALMSQSEDSKELVSCLTELLHHLLHQCPGMLPPDADLRVLSALFAHPPVCQAKPEKEPQP